MVCLNSTCDGERESVRVCSASPSLVCVCQTCLPAALCLLAFLALRQDRQTDRQTDPTTHSPAMDPVQRMGPVLVLALTPTQVGKSISSIWAPCSLHPRRALGGHVHPVWPNTTNPQPPSTPDSDPLSLPLAPAQEDMRIDHDTVVIFPFSMTSRNGWYNHPGVDPSLFFFLSLFRALTFQDKQAEEYSG